MGASQLQRKRQKCVLVLGVALGVGVVYVTLDGSIPSRSDRFNIRTRQKSRTSWLTPRQLPPELASVYSENDFNNTDGVSPPFWVPPPRFNCSAAECAPSTSWGPCYPPPKDQHNNWKALIRHQQSDSHKVHYHDSPKRPQLQSANPDPDLSGYCRPGFIIIGAGKCGTSSLYHYLIGHPRVLPAKKKQIHYFKYHEFYNTEWYLAHFPTTTSFLSSGALMTGEASPGYLPYPNVAHLATKRMPGPKIIAIGREPLDRSWSSYKYNYVIPAMDKLRRGHHRGAPAGESDDYYRRFLFSFQDMIEAELAALKKCLKPGGTGELGAQKEWQHKPWAKEEFDRRDQEGLPPLVDLDKFCYPKGVSSKVPRRQWSQMVQRYPEKVINLPNLHLVQAFIGRSLYSLPLEWWYLTHGPSQVYFMCTEELRDETGEPLNELGKFLGLPDYDFSEVVSKGMYNVGYNKGYDKATTWDDVETHNNPDNNTIPISDELRKELMEFVRPFNERLFQLTGKRCKW